MTRTLKRLALHSLIATLAASVSMAAQAQTSDDKPQFKRVHTQFIAALGDPSSTRGSGAETWGIWRRDPGPRGVWLKDYEKLEAAGGAASSGWQFDNDDWWLDENGILMEKPQFPLPPGRYVVTGDREVITMLTVHPKDSTGSRKWELADGTLHDVTHMPCRTARYTPAEGQNACTPAQAVRDDFPVTPGGLMPAVNGCSKQDYSVLFIIGVEVKS